MDTMGMEEAEEDSLAGMGEVEGVEVGTEAEVVAVGAVKLGYGGREDGGIDRLGVLGIESRMGGCFGIPLFVFF